MTPSQLIALDFEKLARLTLGERQRLRKWAEAGATVYVRGGLRPGCVYSLMPFSNQRFEFSIEPSQGYHFSTHQMLPSAVAGESVAIPLSMPYAAGLDGRRFRTLLSGDGSGVEWPLIFEMDIGAGVVIFDLHGDEHAEQADLLTELSDPATRAAAIGALAAIDWAAGRDPSIPAAVNLVIDDRPVNFDYFSLGNLKLFLDYLNTRYSDIHIDFAWTPNHTRPARRYIEMLKRYNTGFVWHGFLRHIDHRTISDFESELRAGIVQVDKISRTYNVRFQPVMIFPFEKDTPQAHELLRRTQFIAKVQSDCDSKPSNFYRLRALQEVKSAEGSVSIIFRDSTDNLSRERMLALATLGMPVIALAHPADLALRRFARRDATAASYFDSVLQFAAEKSLRAMSLEEIAAEVPLN